VIGIENRLAVVSSEDILDKEIAGGIVYSLERRAMINPDDVNVQVRKGDVALTGTVPTHAARREACESALYTYGVSGIEERSVVSGTESL
jgi:osmotically-inducible protein OsmY